MKMAVGGKVGGYFTEIDLEVQTNRRYWARDWLHPITWVRATPPDIWHTVGQGLIASSILSFLNTYLLIAQHSSATVLVGRDENWYWLGNEKVFKQQSILIVNLQQSWTHYWARKAKWYHITNSNNVHKAWELWPMFWTTMIHPWYSSRTEVLAGKCLELWNFST